MRSLHLGLCLLLLCFCCTVSADIDTLISNYPPDTGAAQHYLVSRSQGYYGYAIGILPNDNDPTPGESLPLASVTVAIQDALGGRDDLRLYLASDSAGSPGASVCSFISYGSLPAGGWDGNVQLSPLTSYEVQEGTQYWLVAELDPATFSTYYWDYATGSDPVGRIGQTLRLLSGGVWTGPMASSVAFQMLVPEPASLGLLAMVGLAGLLGRRRRAA